MKTLTCTALRLSPVKPVTPVSELTEGGVEVA